MNANDTPRPAQRGEGSAREAHRTGEGRPPHPAFGHLLLRGAGEKGLFFALFLLSSCSFFSRSKPPQVFSLDVLPGTVANMRGTRVGIGTIELPPGFDRREIVVRQQNQQLEVRESQLWSANLGELVVHTLAFDLAGRLPEGTVVLPGEAKPATPFRTIDVAFQDLAAGPGNSVTLDAQWVLHDPGRADAAHHEHIVIDVSTTGSADVANGLSRALASLADHIAAALP